MNWKINYLYVVFIRIFLMMMIKRIPSWKKYKKNKNKSKNQLKKYNYHKNRIIIVIKVIIIL